MLLLTIFPTPSSGHDARPLYIEIVEYPRGYFGVSWRVPSSVSRENSPQLHFPIGCDGAAMLSPSMGYFQRSVHCTEGSLDGAIQILYPVRTPSLTTVVRFRDTDGRTRYIVTPPGDTELRLPAPGSASLSTFEQFFAMGVRHFISGYDHILFLTCLGLVALSAKRILLAVTGFTIAHSLSLALASIGFVKLPSEPVELLIGLSVVLMARELIRQERNTIIRRHPIVAACGFGLLHGLGFAGAFSQAGAIADGLLIALFSFNLGIEIGQAMFIVLVVALIWLLRSRRGHATDECARPAYFESPHIVVPIAYTTGTIACFFVIQRIVDMGA